MESAKEEDETAADLTPSEKDALLKLARHGRSTLDAVAVGSRIEMLYGVKEHAAEWFAGTVIQKNTEAGSWQVLFDHGDKDSIAWPDLSGKVRKAQALDDNGKRQLISADSVPAVAKRKRARVSDEANSFEEQTEEWLLEHEDHAVCEGIGERQASGEAGGTGTSFLSEQEKNEHAACAFMSLMVATKFFSVSDGVTLASAAFSPAAQIGRNKTSHVQCATSSREVVGAESPMVLSDDAAGGPAGGVCKRLMMSRIYDPVLERTLLERQRQTRTQRTEGKRLLAAKESEKMRLIGAEIMEEGPVIAHWPSSPYTWRPGVNDSWNSFQVSIYIATGF